MRLTFDMFGSLIPNENIKRFFLAAINAIVPTRLSFVKNANFFRIGFYSIKINSCECFK